MNFDYTPKVQELRQKLSHFFDEHIYPNERAFNSEVAANRANGNAWVPTELIEKLKEQARDAGLWNLFLPDVRTRRGTEQPRICAAVRDHGPRDGHPRCSIARAPDTGNMETLERYGSEAQKQRWLRNRCCAARSARHS
jgi:acyl-CoA dehydrogenase